MVQKGNSPTNIRFYQCKKLGRRDKLYLDVLCCPVHKKNPYKKKTVKHDWLVEVKNLKIIPTYKTNFIHAMLKQAHLTSLVT